MSSRTDPLKCDVCGRFIAYRDQGKSVRRLVVPDSACTVEAYETLCSVHAELERKDLEESQRRFDSGERREGEA
jgi:hypothetical protein